MAAAIAIMWLAPLAAWLPGSWAGGGGRRQTREEEERMHVVVVVWIYHHSKRLKNVRMSTT